MAEHDPLSFEDLRKSLSRLEAEVEILKRASSAKKYDYKLLNAGLTKGTRGVAAILFLFLIVFVTVCVLRATTSTEYMTPNQLLGFAGIQAATLLLYFVFIFSYTRAFMTRWRSTDRNKD